MWIFYGSVLSPISGAVVHWTLCVTKNRKTFKISPHGDGLFESKEFVSQQRQYGDLGIQNSACDLVVPASFTVNTPVLVPLGVLGSPTNAPVRIVTG